MKLLLRVPARPLAGGAPARRAFGTSTEELTTAVEGCTAHVEYTGSLEDGTVFDSNSEGGGEALKLKVGGGSMIPGFDRAVLGMEVGETKSITLAPEDAFGAHDEDGVVEVSLKQLPEGVEAGSALQAQDGRRLRVLSVDSEKGVAMLDMNHPLAGKTLNFTIKLLRCKPEPVLVHETTTPGDGKTFPAPGDHLTMHYTGTLADDGTQFDSSVGRAAFEFQIGVGQVIQGWDQGVAKMSLGEKATLRIPADLGYGDAGAGGVIPPGADLVFEVELLDIKRAAAAGDGHSHGPGGNCDGNH